MAEKRYNFNLVQDLRDRETRIRKYEDRQGKYNFAPPSTGGGSTSWDKPEINAFIQDYFNKKGVPFKVNRSALTPQQLMAHDRVWSEANQEYERLYGKAGAGERLATSPITQPLSKSNAETNPNLAPPFEDFMAAYIQSNNGPSVLFENVNTLPGSQQGEWRKLYDQWLEKSKAAYAQAYGEDELKKATVRAISYKALRLPQMGSSELVKKAVEPSLGIQTASPMDIAFTAMDVGVGKGLLTKPAKAVEKKVVGKVVDTGTGLQMPETAGAMGVAGEVPEPPKPSTNVPKGTEIPVTPSKPSLEANRPPAGENITLGEPPKVPPEKPPVATGAASVPPSGENVVQKLTRLIKESKPVRKETEALKHTELSKRSAIGASILAKGEGKQAFQASKGALKGQLPQAEFTPPESGLTETDITSLYNQIRDSDKRFFEKLNTSEALDTLMTGRIPTEGEIKLLEDMFGRDLVKAILDKRSLGTKVFQGIMDVANLPRAVLSSFDVSAPLRQGLVLGTRHPIASIQSIKSMFKALAREKNALELEQVIKARPHSDIGKDYKLYQAPLTSNVSLTAREESFMTRYAQKIPGIRHSERAYVSFLNDLRSRIWENGCTALEKVGGTANDYKQLAEFINWGTGRGTIPHYLSGSTATILNATLFSPRLLLSRLELPTKLISSSPYVRKQAWQTLGTFLGFGASIIGIAKLAGARVEEDPRSSDFGKVKIGNTRLDFWGGYLQYARFATQLATAERKNELGQITEYNRRDVIDKFLQSKYSPAMGLFNDLIRGETYMGDDITMTAESAKEQAYQRLTPLFIQDMIDAIKVEGMPGGLAALPSALGVGITTYTTPASKIKAEIDKYQDEINEYYQLPSDEARRNYANIKDPDSKKKWLEQNPGVDNKSLLSREEYRITHPNVEAILFVTGNVTSLSTQQAKQIVSNYMKESNVPNKDIRGLQVPGDETQTKDIMQVPVKSSGSSPTYTPRKYKLDTTSPFKSSSKSGLKVKLK